MLIAAGANLGDIDNQKNNCLHFAALHGRAEVIDVILTSNPNMVNIRNKQSMTAIGLASKGGHIEAVKVLLKYKAKLNIGCGVNRMTPLCFAAAYGHLELCEFLIENKARVLGKDKFKRNPLILACRNGHATIVSLLLQYGAEWNTTDSSMNTPLHYAAAYGWL